MHSYDPLLYRRVLIKDETALERFAHTVDSGKCESAAFHASLVQEIVFPDWAYGMGPLEVSKLAEILHACPHVHNLRVRCLFPHNDAVSGELSAVLSSGIQPTRLAVDAEILSVSFSRDLPELGKHLTHLEISNIDLQDFPSLPFPRLTHLMLWIGQDITDLADLLDQLKVQIARFPPHLKRLLWVLQTYPEIEDNDWSMDVLGEIEAMREPSVVVDLFPLIGGEGLENPKPNLFTGDMDATYLQADRHVRPTGRDVWDIVEEMVQRRAHK
jgi:hypothetical protein